MKITTTKLIAAKKTPKVISENGRDNLIYYVCESLHNQYLEGIIVESLVFTFMYQFNTCYLISYVD